MVDRTESLLGKPTRHVAVAPPSPPLPPRSRVPHPGCTESRHRAQTHPTDAIVGDGSEARCRILAIGQRTDAHVVPAPSDDASRVPKGPRDSALGSTLCQEPDSLITAVQCRAIPVGLTLGCAMTTSGTLREGTPLVGVDDPPVVDLPPLPTDSMSLTLAAWSRGAAHRTIPPTP